METKALSMKRFSTFFVFLLLTSIAAFAQKYTFSLSHEVFSGSYVIHRLDYENGRMTVYKSFMTNTSVGAKEELINTSIKEVWVASDNAIVFVDNQNKQVAAVFSNENGSNGYIEFISKDGKNITVVKSDKALEKPEIFLNEYNRLCNYVKQNITAPQTTKESLYASNRIAGENFLKENKRKKGVKTTASGLQYKVIRMGYGEKPTEKQKVKVDYEGRLIDGTVFESSYKNGRPSTLQINQLIKGWIEALQLMPVGSKWEIYIPYQLAYGAREVDATIKPYSALIFTIELRGIER